MNFLIIISLLAAGLAVMVFVHALRHAHEGNQDELGFHPDAKSTTASATKARPAKKRRAPAAARPFGARPVAGAR
jgi:hypothetical protein